LLACVNSAVQLVFRGGVLAGALAGGVLAGVLGVRGTMLVSGIGFLASTLWLVFSPVTGVRELPVPPRR